MLESQQITNAMPIQEQAIPHALGGRDIVAIAQTGTGKTLAFGLPSLTRIAQDRSKSIKMLVVCPTRELAEQIHHVLEIHAKKNNLNSCCVYGGVSIKGQVNRLRKQPSIVVATPGRLLDHINRGNVNFSKLQILVLDEADRMLDMGFLPDIKSIVAELPKKRQTLLFSATFPEATQTKLKGFISNPVHIEIASEFKTADNIMQSVYPVAAARKEDLLQKLLQQPEVTSTLVFTRTKIRAEEVCQKLRTNGFRADSIHGDCTQVRRMSAIKNFKSGKSSVLVATDVAARGIDIHGVTHVINYDIPVNPDDYVHRIGRTARAKAEGTAYTFASPGEANLIRSIERTIGKSLLVHDWEGAVQLKKRKPRSSANSTPKRTKFNQGAPKAGTFKSRSKSAAFKTGSDSRPNRYKAKSSTRDESANKSQPARNNKKRKRFNTSSTEAMR